VKKKLIRDYQKKIGKKTHTKQAADLERNCLIKVQNENEGWGFNY